jgi:hypothetical protein
MFDDHHGELAKMLLDQADFLGARISQLTARIEEQITSPRGRLGHRRRRHHRPRRRGGPSRAGPARRHPAG